MSRGLLAPEPLGAGLTLRRFLRYTFRLLLLAAAAEMLLWRVLSYAPPPTSPQAYQTYDALRNLALQAVSVAHICSVLFSAGALVWLYRSPRSQHKIGSLLLLALTQMSLLLPFLDEDPTIWLAFNAVFLMAAFVFSLGLETGKVTAKALPVMMLATYIPALVFKVTPVLSQALPATIDVESGALFFSASEGVAVLGPFVLIAHFRSLIRRDFKAIATATALTSLFLWGYSSSPWLTTALSMLTIGFTLYLPIPVYAAALWAFSYTLVRLVRRRDASWIALLLILISGLTFKHPYLYLLAADGLLALTMSRELFKPR